MPLLPNHSPSAGLSGGHVGSGQQLRPAKAKGLAAKQIFPLRRSFLLSLAIEIRLWHSRAKDHRSLNRCNPARKYVKWSE
jgi:hypothetical protein